MKRTLSCFLALLLMLICISGCSQSNNPSEETNSRTSSTATDTTKSSSTTDTTPGTESTTSENAPTTSPSEESDTSEESVPAAPQSSNPPSSKPESVSPPATSAPPQTSVPTTPPASSETPPEEPRATAADAQAIADKIVEYINSFRSSPAIKLPGLTKYAEYRSRQLVSNFAHDTKDERAAATALKYGEYIDPPLYGMTGDPYYEVNAREAIGYGGYRGTIDYVARKFAEGFRNSSGHWAYVGDSKYAYIAVGVTYESGMWYCDVAVARENTDNL